MEFSKIQKRIVENADKYKEKYKVNIDADFAIVKLYEEVGELSEAALVYNKQCRPEKFLSEEEAKENIGKEIADVIGVAIVYANLLGIDLEKAIDKKWINKKE